MLSAPKGNLITNGDFEEGAPGAPPVDWISANALTVGDCLAFTGTQAASLGEADPSCPAVLYQDVSVTPLHRYQLSFQLGVNQTPGADLIVEVRWLDHLCTDAGPGLSVFISGASSPNAAAGSWDAQVHLTECAPICTCMARVLFSRSPGPNGTDPNIVDAVVFADIT